MNFRNAYGDLITRRIHFANQWAVQDPSIATSLGDGIFLGLARGQTTVTGTHLNRSASAAVQFTDPVPPEIVGTWSGTWFSETDPTRSGTMSMTISGTIFNMTATVTWTDRGETWHAFSTSDPTNRIIENPGSSVAQFWGGYTQPGQTGGVQFFRFFQVSSTTNSRVADGIASDGSGIDAWVIHMTR